MEIRLHFLLSLLLSAQSGGEPSLTVISQSNLFSHSQFGRQIELTSVLPTNESFIINFEEGYFLCPKKLGNPSKKFRLSRICDGYKDCALGSDELSFDLKCAKDCDPPCSPHGLCMRASALDPKGHCRCDDGYGGADCRAVNVNECKYRPCGMMSECIDKLNGYECKCLPGFQGNGFNCASPEGVISSVKNLLNSDDSSQFKDPNIDLVAPLNKPSYLGTPEQSTSLPTQTEASNQHKPLSILLPVSPTDVVDKVKKILGNNGRRKFRPGSVSTLVTPKFDSIPRIPSHNQNPDKIEPLNPRKSIETKNSNVAFPFPNRPFDINHLNIDPQEKSTTAFPSIDVNKNRPFLPVIRPSSPVTKLDLKEEDIFLKELNQIEPQISREDPRLVACRRQFQGCTDVRGSCMKDLRSCSLSVLDVSDGTRGKLWGECIMDHHMCIMNQEPFCMRGFQKCSMAAIEALKNQLPRHPYAQNVDDYNKSTRLRYEGQPKGPFTLSFHFRVCVNGYLDCLETRRVPTVEDCKVEFDGCSLRLLNASRAALSVRTQVSIPGLSKCIQSFAECIDLEGLTCYADYNRCTLVALEVYAESRPSSNLLSTTERAPSTKFIVNTSSNQRFTTRAPSSTSFSSIGTDTKTTAPGLATLDICKPFGAPNKFGSFSGRPAASTVDCVWDYFACTKRYGSYPTNKACCDARFMVCCNHVMTGGHGSGGSFGTLTTTEPSNSYGPIEEPDNCSSKLMECTKRRLKTDRQCKLEFNECTLLASGMDPSTKRPINDIDLPDGLPEFLRPSISTIKPIQDIDLPQNQEFILQSGGPDNVQSFLGQPQVITADENFMACLLKHFECTNDCPQLKTCSELAGVEFIEDGDNFGEESVSSQEFFLPPVNFTTIGSSLLSSAEDKERMFCVREFFSCKKSSTECKLLFTSCVDKQDSFTREDLCKGVEGSPENYLIPHPLDCTKFYSCQSLGPNQGYRAHLMDCPFSTGFDKKLKICNFIQSLPRCKDKSSKTGRVINGRLARNGRSEANVGEVGFLTSVISSSGRRQSSSGANYILLLTSVTIVFVPLRLS